jgi:catechol 2,3-dioxygenase-like lactoylglutathione lyase family enzyme
VIGIDHVYVIVRDLRRSEVFYDHVMLVLGFSKGRATYEGLAPTTLLQQAIRVFA